MIYGILAAGLCDESEQRVRGMLEQLSADLANVHGTVTPSLVQIRRAGKAIGAGTIWQANGLIVTNAHVVEGRSHGPTWRVAANLSVALADGRDLPARVLAVDPAADLAALKIDAAGLTPIALGDSRGLRPGQTVVAFGFPYGAVGGATFGSVVATVGALPESRNRDGEWLAAGLHLRPGHSGGPMVDAQGRLVGINTLMNGPDVGVAVPVHLARAFVERAAQASKSLGVPSAQAAPAPTWV